MLILKIIVLILIADFITGFFHFLLDQYGKPDARFFKHAIEINLQHHDNPRKMVKRDYWLLTKDSWKLSVVIFAISFLIAGFHWEVLFVLILGANTNIIHKWSHQTKRENFAIVSFLQKLKVIQTRTQHAHHHKAPFDTHFCIMTNFWNPVLEKIYFWETCIKALKLVGIQPVAGSNLRNGL